MIVWEFEMNWSYTQPSSFQQSSYSHPHFAPHILLWSESASISLMFPPLWHGDSMLRLLLTLMIFLLCNSYSLGKLSDMYLDVLANAHILFSLDVPTHTFYKVLTQAWSSSIHSYPKPFSVVNQTSLIPISLIIF